ncbi:unnamed protein product [Didymodactylos carnosus]|uniref:Nucleotide-diphospho-sugar transferase domain-containing protein n=1 Tax=Didymodactylos carnosus TaxID=1234261 RepID=A0A815HTS1_9BILA|nr:unnamed protein product [Didymodactylos carnosus]CAF4236548.1 unnamed protein product [Didymodactylos carnosus]
MNDLFGKVQNYIVVVGDQKSLKVCIELNLPCYNGSNYLAFKYKQITFDKDAEFSDKISYNPLTWFKIPFYLDVIRKGYTIITTDTDIAYSSKNVWESYEKYARDVGADMVFASEHPINTGNFYSLSNERVIALFNEWIMSESRWLNDNDQEALIKLHNKNYMLCNTREMCNQVKSTSMNYTNSTASLSKEYQTNMVAVRTYRSSFSRFGSHCSPPSGVRMDPCAADVLFIHTICMIGKQRKADKLNELGFWMLDEPCRETTTVINEANHTTVLSIYRCVPKILALPRAEDNFTKCNEALAWT